jgi:hypothetical protein
MRTIYTARSDILEGVSLRDYMMLLHGLNESEFLEPDRVAYRQCQSDSTHHFASLNGKVRISISMGKNKDGRFIYVIHAPKGELIDKLRDLLVKAVKPRITNN